MLKTFQTSSLIMEYNIIYMMVSYILHLENTKSRHL